MRVFDAMQSKNIDELAEWFDECGVFDGSLHMKWWDENYCNKCEPVVAYVPTLDKECEFGWCEINDKCKFFKEMDDIPDNKQIIKMWLESEVVE